MNSRGETYFLEGDVDWIDEFRHEQGLNIFKVSYTTRINQWAELMNRPDKLELTLPEQISKGKWDVVLVDAPMGHRITDFDDHGKPIQGRMQSIYMASKLVRPGGYVFAHDCNRQVEKVYLDKYFADKKLLYETKHTLRCYAC